MVAVLAGRSAQDKAEIVSAGTVGRGRQGHVFQLVPPDDGRGPEAQLLRQGTHVEPLDDSSLRVILLSEFLNDLICWGKKGEKQRGGIYLRS
jgi:hypothetical protein